MSEKYIIKGNTLIATTSGGIRVHPETPEPDGALSDAEKVDILAEALNRCEMHTRCFIPGSGTEQEWVRRRVLETVREALEKTGQEVKT